MARALRRKAKPKVRRRYMLLPAEQRRAGGIPVGNHIFRGTEVIETEENLEQFVGLLLQHAPESKKAADPKPKSAPKPKPKPAPAPEPEPVVAEPELEPEPEPEPKPESKPKKKRKKKKDEDEE